MKKNRTALIVAAIAVVLVAALYVVTKLIPSPEPDVSPSPSPTDKLSLIAFASKDLKSATVALADGKEHTVFFETDNMRIEPASQGFSYSMDKLTGFLYAVADVPAIKLIYDDPTERELAETGLDKPDAVCTVHPAEGDPITLTIGKETATASGRYAQVNGDKAVYLISRYKCNTIMQPESVYRELEFFHTYEEGTELKNALVYFLWQYNGQPVEAAMRTDEELKELTEGGDYYHLLRPFEADAAGEFLMEKLIVPITTIKPTTIVEDDPEDLAKYGLENPVPLTLRDLFGWERTLLIGSRDAKTGGRFVMFPETSVVLLDVDGDYSFLEVSPVKLRSKLLFLYNIKAVDKVQASLDGRDITLDFDLTDEVFTATLNGGEITEINARRLYSRMIGFFLEDETPQDAVKGEVKLNIILTMLDGKQRTLTLYTLNERQLAAWVDGKDTGFYVNIKQYKYLLDGLELIEAGGEIVF